MATSYTRDSGFTRARRLGRDEEEGREEIREMLDDPEVTAGELIAALVPVGGLSYQLERPFWVC